MVSILNPVGVDCSNYAWSHLVADDTVIGWTDAELEALHVPSQVLAEFLRALILSRGGTVKARGFYPSTIPTYTPEDTTR